MSDTVFMDCSNFFLLTHCEAVIDRDDWLEASAKARGICIGPFGDEVLARRDGSWFYIDPADLRRGHWDNADELTHLGWLACERVLAERVARETSMDSCFAVRCAGDALGPAQGVRG